MKFIVLTVLSCALMLEAVPFGAVNLANAFRKGLMELRNKNQLNDRDQSGEDFNRNPLDLTGADWLNEGARDLGLGELGLGRQSQNSGYRRGSSQAAQNYNQDANGAAGQAAHNSGAKEFHNVGQHHNKVTSVSQAENDDSHNIGGSQAHNVGSVSGGHFNKHQSGASEAANDAAQGSQQSDVAA